MAKPRLLSSFPLADENVSRYSDLSPRFRAAFEIFKGSPKCEDENKSVLRRVVQCVVKSIGVWLGLGWPSQGGPDWVGRAHGNRP
uniref:Uncharacterized protein n=1 Tax=Vespula pensylvanica TaxID=30213 RepID=A0A834NYA4_VESPE|nr:hypothetical protein H0235_009343 [Vespula pensylvanica]